MRIPLTSNDTIEHYVEEVAIKVRSGRGSDDCGSLEEKKKQIVEWTFIWRNKMTDFPLITSICRCSHSIAAASVTI